MQLWTAIRVLDRGLRSWVAEAIKQPHVAQAAEFLVFLADLYRAEKLLELSGEHVGRVGLAFLVFATIDAALAAENMVVMAEALGYGTCFIGGIHRVADRLIESLRLPPRTLPLFGLVIGVPDEEPPPRPRLPLEMLVHEGGYRDYAREELERAARIMAPVARGDWLRILRRYLGPGGVFEERSRTMLNLARRQQLPLEVREAD
jgi:hypothetical protein